VVATATTTTGDEDAGATTSASIRRRIPSGRSTRIGDPLFRPATAAFEGLAGGSAQCRNPRRMETMRTVGSENSKAAVSPHSTRQRTRRHYRCTGVTRYADELSEPRHVDCREDGRTVGREIVLLGPLFGGMTAVRRARRRRARRWSDARLSFVRHDPDGSVCRNRTSTGCRRRAFYRVRDTLTGPTERGGAALWVQRCDAFPTSRFKIPVSVPCTLTGSERARTRSTAVDDRWTSTPDVGEAADERVQPRPADARVRPERTDGQVCPDKCAHFVARTGLSRTA
jgi:hypothetical protein